MIQGASDNLTSSADCCSIAASRPRVLFVNRSYWPDVEATGQLLTELCEDLAGEFDVHVLCGQPRSIADAADAAAFTPQRCETRRGVTIHRSDCGNVARLLGQALP